MFDRASMLRKLMHHGLLDAQRLARSHPEDFTAPSQAELDEISYMDEVQICISGEFLWCWIGFIWEDLLGGVCVKENEETWETTCETYLFQERHIFRIMVER